MQHSCTSSVECLSKCYRDETLGEPNRKYNLIFAVLQDFFNYTKMTSKDSHDPGWNDPPIFTFDKAAAIQAAAATKKGISLNKRVAFPISSNSETQQKSVEANLPFSLGSSSLPPKCQSSHLSEPCTKPEATIQADVEIGAEERLKRVLQNLQIETNCDEEIIKRLRIMEKMWTDGKLEKKVQCKVFELSEALVKGDTDTADHIQMGLMVDYISQCSSWMSGIRHLINQKKK